MPTNVGYQILIDGFPDAELTSQASEIEVLESVRGATTARVKLPIDISGNDFSLLGDDRLSPGKDHLLTVIAIVDTSLTVLSHGPIIDRKIEIEDGGLGSFLEIATSDRRILMDRACRVGSAQSGPVFAIVMAILTKYQFIPDVDFSFSTLYFELTQTLNQAGSDLALIETLAGQHGAEFWIDWTFAGVVLETAHFKPSPAAGLLSPPISVPLLSTPKELRINAGSSLATMQKFSSQWFSEAPNTSGSIARVDIDGGRLQTGSVSGPDVRRFGDDPGATAIECQVLSAGDMSEATRRQTAALNDASWVIRASAESSVHAFGGLIRPHETIPVRGVGTVDSGDYFVDSVRHQLTPNDHLMSVQLRRNAVTKGLSLGF
jgi:hypothetical protein